MAHIQQGGPDEKEKTTALKDLLSRIDLDELMKKDEPPLDFPDTLEGFEYAFNEKGQLRHIKTGEPFVFNYREDLHRWNQKRYEALGEIITKYVYELLEKDCNLKKISIPVDATESEPKSFIFMSEDALTNPQKLMVLIHGSGVVRAGQWARRLIINEDLDSGTQIPFIKRAMDCKVYFESYETALESSVSSYRELNIALNAEGYGVIVLNPNENYIEVEKPKIHVQSSSDSSDEPAEKRERKDKVSKETKKRRDFYEKYRNPQREKEMMQLYIRMIQREADVKSKVTAVALTDSVHNVWHQEAGKTIREWMREFIGPNGYINSSQYYITSPPPCEFRDEMMPCRPRVGAGEVSAWFPRPSEVAFPGPGLVLQCIPTLALPEDASAAEKEMEQLAKELRQKRMTLGYSQADVGFAMGALFGKALSQATICRLEAQQLSLANMWKLRPLLKMWLEQVDMENLLGLRKMETILQQARKRRRAYRERRIGSSLEKLFLQCQKPTPQQISCIAGQLQLQEDLVRVWFHNRSKMGSRPSNDFSPLAEHMRLPTRSELEVIQQECEHLTVYDKCLKLTID
eukprot:bmy_04046T0